MSKHILRETLAVRRNIQVNANNLKDQVVAIQRVTKVVKGGKNLSFSALVVVGERGLHEVAGVVQLKFRLTLARTETIQQSAVLAEAGSFSPVLFPPDFILSHT